MTDAPEIPLLVFSDLDGTLLDHESYSFDPARPVLAKLKDNGAGVVLATSKTAAEVAPLRATLGLSDWPAIVENGAGLLVPGDTAKAPGAPYAKLRAALDDIPADLRAAFTGFGDMTAEDVARVTGLPHDAATLAKQRGFSEPGLFDGPLAQRSAFISALADKGISARDGGRFLTLSFGHTKAARMGELVAEFRPAHTVALGDAPNDVEMLEHAETGIIVPNPHAPPLPPLSGEDTGRILRAPAPGPSGWAAALTALLAHLDLTKGTAAHG